MGAPLRPFLAQRLQRQRDRLAAFVAKEPAGPAQLTRRTMMVQQLHQTVDQKHQLATEITNHLAAVKDILAQGVGAKPKAAPSVERKKA